MNPVIRQVQTKWSANCVIVSGQCGSGKNMTMHGLAALQGFENCAFVCTECTADYIIDRNIPYGSIIEVRNHNDHSLYKIVERAFKAHKYVFVEWWGMRSQCHHDLIIENLTDIAKENGGVIVLGVNTFRGA